MIFIMYYISRFEIDEFLDLFYLDVMTYFKQDRKFDTDTVYFSYET